MKNKYPPKKVTMTFNDIRSGHKPDKGRMLFILVGSDLYIGGYSGRDGWWDGERQNVIEESEITAWAYMPAVIFPD